MSSSTGLGGVVGEGAWGAGESVVEADGGCECEEACVDAGAESVQGAGAVAFEGEQVFAGLEDRFDSLADRREMWVVTGFVFAARPADGRVELLGGVFELAAGVALVADDGDRAVSLAALQQLQADVAFGSFGRGQRQRTWCPVQGEQGVQPETP